MVPGRIAITARALERTVTAVSARHLRVPVSDIGVRLSDERGELAVSVTSPLSVEPLAASRTGAVTRTQDARAAIAKDVTAITGSTVRTVTVRLTRAIVIESERVS